MVVQYERELVRRPCVTSLRAMIELNQLKRYPFLYWTCPPDPGRKKPHQAHNMKLDGYTKGNFDMTIIAAGSDVIKVWLIEFKYGKNDYTTEQEAIAESCEGVPVQAIKIYSLNEFQLFLKENL